MKQILLKAGSFLLLLACAGVWSISGCHKPETLAVTTRFDKESMLVYYADSLIVPGYSSLASSLTALDSAVEHFISDPQAATQAEVKIAYEAAHLQYERVAAFQFGPAETYLLDVFLNYSGGLDNGVGAATDLAGFSIDTATIEANVLSSSYDLTTTTRNSLYSQGFPALNYLLFAPGAIAAFSSHGSNRASYIRAVVRRMETLNETVRTQWTTYRSTFVENTKTNVGSPIGNMVNQLAYQMDLLKGPRIGWPFGKQSGNLIFASKVEAYYAGISVKLASENLKSLKKLYTASGSGKGIANYLVALGQSQLNNDVLAQFDIALDKLQQIPDPLSQSLVTQPALVDSAYKEIQKLLTLLKTDVASATAVQITFMDNDGD